MRQPPKLYVYDVPCFEIVKLSCNFGKKKLRPQPERINTIVACRAGMNYDTALWRHFFPELYPVISVVISMRGISTYNFCTDLVRSQRLKAKNLERTT